MVVGLVFTSCEPMEDIHAAIDAQEHVISGAATFAMSDDDYDYLDLDHGNFNSADDAKDMIPDLLENNYPVWGGGSLAAVTFKIYSPKDTYSGIVSELTSAEMNAITGNTYGNFSRDYHIFNYLDATYLSPSDGDFHSLKYEYYSGGESDLTNGFAYENGEWMQITGFTEDEYKVMGESYPNFSSDNEAEAKMPIFLVDRFKFNPKSAGDIVPVMYELSKKDENNDRYTESNTDNYIFDGASWSKYNDVIEETVKFGHDGNVWVPDNTIKYTLTQADYDLVGNGYRGNFDVRSGKDEELESVRLDKINTILLNNFPGMTEEQKFVVIYNVWNDGDFVWEMKVILSGGAYVLQ